MSDSYDGFEYIGDDSSDCCCCEPTETVVDDWTEEPAFASDDVVEDWTEAPSVVSYDEPVALDDVVIDAREELPVAAAAPVIAEAPTAVSAAYGPGVGGDAPTISLVGGSDPYGHTTIVDAAGNVANPAAVLASSATIGGTDPYGGMTIVDAAGAPAQLTTSMVIGGPNAFSEASIGYTADMARFEQLTYGQKMADMFGGTPEIYEGTPKVALYPTAGESVNDIMVRSVVTTQASNLLSRIQSAMRNGY